MDLEAPPPMFDDAAYPMSMGDEAFSGPENAPAAAEAPPAPVASARPEAASFPQLPPVSRPEQRPPRRLESLPAPPPMLEADYPRAPMVRPPAHQGGHGPSTRPHHGRHRMHGYGQPAFGDDTPQSASNLLGLALVAVPVGGYVGGRYGGALGVLGGMLAAGGFVNGIRAAKGLYTPPADTSETWVSATFAVLGLGAAAYLLYRGHGSKTKSSFQSNKTERAAADHDGAALARYRI